MLAPWMTDYLCSKVKNRKRLYNVMKSQPENFRLKNYYNRYRNNLKNEMRNCKENYYSLRFESASGNTRAQWNLVNGLIKEPTKTHDISQIQLNGDNVTEPREIATAFNNYFIGIANTLRNDLNKSNDQIVNLENKFHAKFIDRSFFLTPTTPDEVTSIIRNLKNGKAPGLDNITTFLLKYILDSIVDILTYLFNYSFQEGEFPQCLKTAVVIPLFKKGDVKCMSNYRPISLLSVFSKVLETIVKKRLVNFLKLNNYLSKNQFGFTEKLSTEDALIEFLEHVYKGVNEKMACGAIYLDITKAFDTVDHDILLGKMWLAGFRGLPFDWFESYLKGRTQKVRVGGFLSDLGSVVHGVPQGSVLGPILFLFYLNDLCDAHFHGKVTAFADDTALGYAEVNRAILRGKMQEDLNLLEYWFSKHFLTLSEKTKYMLFSCKKQADFLNESLVYHSSDCVSSNVCNKCILIEKVDEIKYLGLIINSNLSWKGHVKKLRSELFITVRKFYFLRDLCPKNILVMLYRALVESRLGYALSCWGGTYISTLTPIITLQKHIVRLITKKAKHEHSRPIFLELNLLPFRNLYVYKVLKIFFVRSIANKINPIKNYQLRNTTSVPLPKPNLTLYKHFYTYNAPRLFNQTFSFITPNNDKLHFLSYLKRWLVQKEDIEILLHF
uniref:Reverse transcriptase domain-containing protein n=1 Tax=Graphocephala atropunctata TaxID=36148 RepID=A0A1B6MSN0_9HEMI